MLWSKLKDKAAEDKVPIAIVVAEVLHLAILEGIFSRTESAPVVFQGGTAIHLLHGGYRFSEDLDFAGANLTWTAAETLIAKAKPDIEKVVTQFLGSGQHSWRFPAEKKARKIYAAWYVFQPTQQSQKYRVKIELANYPVYHPQPLTLRSELDILQRRMLVQGLETPELLAEKLAAVFGRPYLKGRDLFDIWYLKKVLATEIDPELLRKKIEDYNVLLDKNTVTKKLKNEPQESLAREMKAFLPARFRRLVEMHSYQAIRQNAETTVNEALRLL